MRRSVLLVLWVATLLGGAPNAYARTLNWMGTMTLDLGRLGTITQTGTGVSTVGGTAGILNTVRIAGGITVQGTAIPVTDPESVISVVSATSVVATLGTGTLRGFATPGPLVWNRLPLPGMARFCFIAGCDDSPPIPFFTTTNTTPSSLGSGLGLVGLITRMGPGITTIGLNAAGWQTSTATLFTSTATSMETPVAATGFVHGVTSQSQLSLNSGRGRLQLITPTQVTTTGPGGETEKIALFTTLTIEFIPEPG
ncbi:MAG: hypothetical protein VCE43_21415, partial [Myxococcota bacterium]